MTTADLAILRFLARRGRATASQIATACTMTEDEVGTHLVTLEFLQLVAARQDDDGGATARVFSVTQAGRRAATATLT